MGIEITGRSTLQIAEDMLSVLTEEHYNVSRSEARFCYIQRRELGKEYRQEAEALMLVWEGTSAQIDQVYSLYRRKMFAIANWRN